MSKYKIIANPTAGGGTGARQIPHIRQLLTEHKLDFDLVVSEYAGHAIELAKKAALEGAEVVVAAGGDGTVNEVLNGIMEAQKEGARLPAMGVLCIGRGNDFAGSAGIPAELELACQALVNDRRRLIDIGRVYGGKYPQGRYFANVMGVGFDAITTIEVRKLPRWGGFLSFLVAVIKTIFLYYKGPVVTVEYDGQTLTQPSLMVSVMNGRRLGGGFYMAPHSKFDDGLFDLCMAHEVSRLRIFSLIPHFMKGTQDTQPEITTGRAAHVSITAMKGVLPAETDGEIICEDGKHLEVELLPCLLEIISDPLTSAV
jgi:diacylglycerol kinase (ATP)